MSNRSEELKFLLKHSSIYGVGTVLSRAVAFVLLPLYTRYLTPTDYGMLELLDTTTGLVGIIVGLGIATSLSRFYYERHTDGERSQLVSTVFILIAIVTTILTGFASMLAPQLAALVLDSSEYAIYFRLAFVNLLLGILVDVGQAYLRMLYKSVTYITISVASLVVGVTLNVIFIVHLEMGLISILFSTFIVRVLIALPLTASILFRTGLQFSVPDARGLLKYSLPILPAALGNVLTHYSDRYFIKSFVSIADAGIYGLAKKLGGALHDLVTSPFISTFIPRRFQIVKERGDDAKDILRATFDTFFMGFLFLSLGVAVFTPEVVAMMTGPAFHGAGDIVPLLLISHLIFAMKYHVEFGIFHAGKTQLYGLVNVVTAVVQLVSGFFLVRAFGVRGAAYALIISTSVNFVLLHMIASRLYPIPFNFLRCAKAMGVAGVAYGLSVMVPGGHMLIAIAIKLVILAGFVAVLPVLKLVSNSEILQVKAITLSFIRRSPLPTGAQS